MSMEWVDKLRELINPAERDALQKQLGEYKMAAAELDGELKAAFDREEKLTERVREQDELRQAMRAIVCAGTFSEIRTIAAKALALNAGGDDG